MKKLYAGDSDNSNCIYGFHSLPEDNNTKKEQKKNLVKKESINEEKITNCY